MHSTPLDTLCTALFVPADRPERFEKAAQSGSDAIIVDLEDAVGPEKKDAARQNLALVPRRVPVIVRVNAIGTEWHDADIATIITHCPDAVMIPKAEHDTAFTSLVAKLAPLPVVALVETARGFADARSIAALPGVERLAFGSIDFCADISCVHDRAILLPVRSELVIAARLAGQAGPLDGVTTDVRRTNVVIEDSLHARHLGMTGKLAIHPAQIALIAEAFAPSSEEVAWARRVLSVGEGVGTVNGQMVDAPVQKRARQILEHRPQQTSATLTE